MDTLRVIWYPHPESWLKILVTRVFDIVSLEALYDYGRLPLHLGGGYGRVMWTAQRGRTRWRNFETWVSFREAVKYRDKGLCQMCGKSVVGWTFVCDHKIPLFKGGKDWWQDPQMTNFQTLCEECNKLKTKADVCVPKTAKEKAKVVSLSWMFELPVDHKLAEFL